MISPHAHISMTYAPPVPEPKHVHRVEKQPKQRETSRRRRTAQFLHLVPRHA